MPNTSLSLPFQKGLYTCLPSIYHWVQEKSIIFRSGILNLLTGFRRDILLGLKKTGFLGLKVYEGDDLFVSRRSRGLTSIPKPPASKTAILCLSIATFSQSIQKNRPMAWLVNRSKRMINHILMLPEENQATYSARTLSFGSKKRSYNKIEA